MNLTISCNALAGITTPTLKIEGHIKKKNNSLTFVQDQMKQRADQHCSERSFDISD